MSFTEAVITPMMLYSAWQVCNYNISIRRIQIILQAFYIYIQYTVIDKDLELVTSLRYLTQVRKVSEKKTISS